LKVLQLASAGDNPDGVLAGIRAFPVEKVWLVHTRQYEKAAVELAATLERIKLQVELANVDGDVFTETVTSATSQVESSRRKYDDILVNLAGGPRPMSYALMTAAFIHGLQALDFMDGKPVSLPLLRFTSNEDLSEAKLRILRRLDELGGLSESLSELGGPAGVKPSLMSFHLRGGRKNRGLEAMGLVRIERGKRGRVRIAITPLGRLRLIGREGVG